MIKSFLIITSFIILSSCSNSHKNHLPKGFTSLFNGKDLTNWHGVMLKPYDNPHKRALLKKNNSKKYTELKIKAKKVMTEHWSIKNGVLDFDGSKKGFSLATNKKYNNFELYASWKIAPNADSGLYLKGAPQIQIWDVQNKSAHRHGANKGSGGLWNNKKTNKGHFPLVVADKPAGEWNTFFIRFVDDIVTIYLNDKLVIDKAPLENTHWSRGMKKAIPLRKEEQLELQAHGSKVQFKDIYIKELP